MTQDNQDAPNAPTAKALPSSSSSSSLADDLERIARIDAKVWIAMSCFFTVVFAIAYVVAYRRGDLLECVMMPILGGTWMFAGYVRWNDLVSNAED